ncbi:MAG: helix-hairpin-helix domain-containing protein [Myxococcota bacterium]
MLSYLLLLASAFAGLLDVEVLDIGQGDSILIQTPAGKVVLIDGGTGKKDVVPMLKERDINTINLLVGTHAHADHIGGLDEVISSVTVKNYMDNGLPHTTKTYEKVMGLIETKDIPYLTAVNGREFNLDDGIKISVIHPQDRPLRNTRSDLNSNSVVLRLTHGDNCFLFTGDAEEPTEDILVQKGLEPCQVLKVAHHGSNHSSSAHFLNAVKPEIALISAGQNNRYNHPGDETLSRLERVGATIYRTDVMGTIHLQSDGKQVRVLKSSGHAKPKPEPETNIDDVSIKMSAAEPPQLEHQVSDSPSDGKLNINTANQSQLESIPGIGPSKASAIIAYRDSHGPFQSHQQLKNVHGIGDKLSIVIEQHTVITE